MSTEKAILERFYRCEGKAYAVLREVHFLIKPMGGIALQGTGQCQLVAVPGARQFNRLA
ncbi:hypothetical protein D3C84_1057190 [compost metagenome]